MTKLKEAMDVPPLKYIFVGGFRKAGSAASSGGQVFACTTLVASPISEHVEWSTIDSTMTSVKTPPVAMRAARAAKRLAKFGLSIGRTDGALIFTASHFSFVEKGLMALTAKAFGKRVVLCPRSGLILDDVERSSFMRWYVPFVLRRADVVVCQGESWKSRYRELANLRADQLFVARNWLDLTDYEEVANRRSHRDGPGTFLFLGRLEAYKGIYDLLDAVAARKNDLMASRFILCGKGAQEARVRTRARELGIEHLLEFRGWVSGGEKLRVLEEADVLVLPSHREGMPNAVLEAMAAGLAVIATAVGGVPDILGTDQTVGVTVPPRTPEALGDALAVINADPKHREKLAKAGRERVIANHDINVLWPTILEMLRL